MANLRDGAYNFYFCWIMLPQPDILVANLLSFLLKFMFILNLSFFFLQNSCPKIYLFKIFHNKSVILCSIITINNFIQNTFNTVLGLKVMKIRD